MHELSIKQFKSSAYHPESQEALEPFHQTFKNIIGMYCHDMDKNWDEGIHLLLFAACVSVQESLAYTPFELVSGHNVRGPLELLKEKSLVDDDGSSNLLQYVCDLARENLKSAQKCMKEKYNKNSVKRSF